MQVKRNTAAPHTVVLFIRAEVHEKLVGTGECSGDPVHKVDRIASFDAADKQLAIRRLNDLLEELHAKNDS